MTENVNLSNVDFVNYGHSVEKLHTDKRGMNTLATVIGIVGLVVVIAILWNLFVRRGELGKNTEKNTDINLGGNNEAINGLKHQVAALTAHERADYGKIMFNDGLLYAGEGYYGGRRREGGCGDRHHEGHCNQKFQRVESFTPSTTAVNITSTCDCA